MAETARLTSVPSADFAAVEEMIKTLVKKLGRIDILVNNAGITRDDLLMKMKEEDFDAVIDTNLKGSFQYDASYGTIIC